MTAWDGCIRYKGRGDSKCGKKLLPMGCIVCIMATITIIHLVDGLSDSAAAAHSASHFVIFLQSSKIRERRIALLEFITQSP